MLRPFNYCVIDEVDSILIDEARTPLIISGSADKPSDKYYKARRQLPCALPRLRSHSTCCCCRRRCRRRRRLTKPHVLSPLGFALEQAAKIATALAKDLHYTVDEKQRNVLLTEEGYEAAEDVLQVQTDPQIRAAEGPRTSAPRGQQGAEGELGTAFLPSWALSHPARPTVPSAHPAADTCCLPGARPARPACQWASQPPPPASGPLSHPRLTVGLSATPA